MTNKPIRFTLNSDTYQHQAVVNRAIDVPVDSILADIPWYIERRCPFVCLGVVIEGILGVVVPFRTVVSHWFGWGKQ